MEGCAGMSTFVLVHGAWHGGWCWERLTPLLEDAGHRVTTPTLTGLGERCDLASAAVDLDTHIDDVLRHLEFERSSDVVLVAHSYAGFVAFGVAERAASAIESLVLLDAFIPLHGETMADHVGSRGDEYRAAAAADPHWLAPAPPAAVLGVPEGDLAWVDGLMTPQPVQTYLQPIALTGAVDAIEDRGYISCTSPGLQTLEESKRRIAAVGMPTAELECGHDAMIAKPEELAKILLG
jgi:pimeloyl-ACP methyl ester carboxylesterase